MPAVPTISPISGLQVPDYYVHTTAGHFVDTSGRTLLLRGVNLSGDSKYPAGQNSYTLDGFWESGESGQTSFVGKPFSLKEADVHLERLRGWGMNMIRYVVCWEALEHEGPGKYDEAFIDHTIAILRKCKEYGFRVFIDPHQDVWSRFSGGSGAPYWTLHAAGLEPRNFTATGGLINNEYPNPENPRPEDFPTMAWPTSYYRLPALTLFTLFFAGKDFAPKCIIDDMNIQDYLQKHMLDAFCHLAERIRDAEDLFDSCVIGWESMNEPSEGFVGMVDLCSYPDEQTLKREHCPTPAQSLRLGSGIAQNVEYYTFTSVGPMKSGNVYLDPEGKSIWLDPEIEPNGVSTKWGWTRDPDWKLGQCVWEQHGVWDKSSGDMKRPDYFRYSMHNKNQKVNFVDEYWFPYWKTWSRRIREVHPDAIHFIQPPLFKPPPKMTEDDIHGRAAYSPHFYDGLTMMTRHWNWFNASTIHVLRKKIHLIQSFKVGDENIKKNFLEQLALFREDVEHTMGAYPVVLGETGTPFDIDQKKSYGRTAGGIHIGNHVQQQRALDASLGATDGNNVYNYTIWAYNPGHSWDHGDGFNGEDLSIWSPDDFAFRRHVKFEKLARAASEGNYPRVAIGGQEISPGDLPNGPAEVKDTELSDQVDTPLPLPSNLTLPPSTDYEFLVDGSRAIAAFCRPYPVKTVGKPKNIVYDISTTTFKLVVTVSPGDSIVRGPVESGDDEGISQMPTEVYIPLTTFSSPPTLFPVPTDDADATEGPTSPGTITPSKSPIPKSPSPPSNTQDAPRRHTVQEAISRLHLSFAIDRRRAAAGYSLHLASDPPLPLNIPDDILDVDVHVTSGHVELRGQKVLWYYEVPKDGHKEYTLVIKKKNAKQTDGENGGCMIM